MVSLNVAPARKGAAGGQAPSVAGWAGGGGSAAELERAGAERRGIQIDAKNQILNLFSLIFNTEFELSASFGSNTVEKSV